MLWFILVIFLLRLDNLASKSVFVIKFACANLTLKTLALWSMFFSSSLIFMSEFVFFTKLLTLGILISTAVNVVFVAKLLHLGFCFLIQSVLFS